MQKLKDKMIGAYVRATTRLHCLREEGQGTTEYAILVGVLAVIAMIAIAASGARSASSGRPFRAE